MSRDNRPNREEFNFSPPDNLPIAESETSEVESKKPDPRVEAALQIYTDILNETGNDALAQEKSWSKLSELTVNEITDTDPFDELAKKMEQAKEAHQNQAPEIPVQQPQPDISNASETESPKLGNESSADKTPEVSTSQLQSDIIIDRTMAEKVADAGVSPIKNTHTNTFEVRSQKQESKEETEVVLEELTDTKTRIETLLQKSNILPEDTIALNQSLKNLKLGISIISKSNDKDEEMLNKAWETIAEAEKILSETEHKISIASEQDAEALAETVKNLLSDSEKQARDIAFGTTDITRRPETAAPAENQDNQSQNKDEQQALAILQPELKKLPEDEREKIGLGLNNYGFYIKEKTNGFLRDTFKWLADKIESKGTAARLLTALSESYKNDSQDARKKMENIAAGQKRTLGNIGYLSGNIMKYGRTLADFVGWTAASPLRYVTISGQILGRGLDVAKEARLKNEEVLDKTRVKDIDAAAEEAWKIREQAQVKAGQKEISAKDLEKAYQENIPQDLLKRLKENAEPNEASSFLQSIFKKHIEFSTNRLQNKIDNIDAKTDLSEEQKTTQKEKLFVNYSKLLNDYDRILSQYGVVDTAAMLAKYGSTSAKWAVRGVMVESLYLGLEKLWDGKIWHDLAQIVHGNIESTAPGTVTIDSTTDLKALEKSPEQYFAHLDSTLGINSKDGLNADELEEIRQYALHAKTTGNQELAQKISEHYKLSTVPIAEKFAAVAPQPKTIPPQFENIIDSSKVSGSDSVWKSTKEIFTGEHAKELGYTGDLNDKIALDKWAETQTANAVKELADKEYNGKMPDLVHGPSTGHAGDKVIVELGTDGKPHLKFVESSGLKSEYLEHTDQAPDQATHPLTSTSTPDTVTSPEIQSSIADTATDTTPITESPRIEKTSFDNFKQTFESAKGLEHDQALISYLNETVMKPENKIDFPPDKINIFARMFPIKGIAENIAYLDSPEKIKKALDIFDQNLHAATDQLINGKLNMPPGEPLFPIVDKNQRVFLAESLEKGMWKLWQLTADNKYASVKLLRRFQKDQDNFDIENLKKILGYEK